MRILYAFICVLLGAGLFLFPITGAVYDFQTDVREDTATVATAAGVTTGNFSLVRAVYDDDVSTITITSDLATDDPAYSSYNPTSRLLVFSGLTADTSRTITAQYDTDALTNAPAIGTLLNITPFLWYAFAVVFIGAAIVAMLIGRG